MGLLRPDAALQALLVTKGHPYERGPFHATFESWPDIACTAVEQPAAQAFFQPEAAAPWDAIVLYDMPGVVFGPDGLATESPPSAYVEGFRRLLERGKGIVVLHHALAGWPSWDEYAEIVGGRFHYAPATLRGERWPDSGYRFGLRHRVRVETPGHPVVEGLGDGFEIEDELYLCPIFEDDALPLLRSDAVFSDEHFHSAALALRGRMHANDGWSHPPGSSLVAWAHSFGRSPIVTITLGDGPSAYANPGFRRLVGNAIRWVAGAAAADWAAERAAG